MKIVIKSMIAGFIATVVLTILMLIKQQMGLMADINPINDLTQLASNYFNIAQDMKIGWLLHFAIGTIAWGILYALLVMRFSTLSNLMRGLLTGLIAWILMMLIFMPLIGAGLFAMNVGIYVTMMTLMLHVIYGVVLGWAYGRL